MKSYLIQSVWLHSLLFIPQFSCSSFLPGTSLHFSLSITSVFFGGGTPSLAPPSSIAAVLETVAKRAGLPGDAEVTLEVNPTPVGMAKLADFRHAGVNRFSVGVQVSHAHFK